MKWSTRILYILLVILVAGLFVSNVTLKKEFQRIDKNDTFWNYGKISQEHFKYIKIEGGNITNIAFEQSPNCSVRILHDWQRVRPNPIETRVSNDTLYLKFTYVPGDEGEKNWMRWLTLVRVFSPELASVEGNNTNFSMFKLRQKNINVSMSGKSKFEVESFIPDLDTITVSQKDSAEIVFEMSPEYKQPIGVEKSKTRMMAFPQDANQKNNETFTVEKLNADLKGNTLLDVGRGRIREINLKITDSSAITLSGSGLRRFCGL